MKKIDKIFICGIFIIVLIGGISDAIYWKGISNGGFPVFSCLSVFVTYFWWFALAIYENIHKNQTKSDLIRWYMFFLLPFIHMFVVIIEVFIAAAVINIFLMFK